MLASLAPLLLFTFPQIGGEWSPQRDFVLPTDHRPYESLCAIADLDGDGIDEILAGSPQAVVGGLELGSALLLSGATGALLDRFDGPSVGSSFGAQLAAIGDFDLDGAEDFAICGAPVGGLSLYSGASRTVLLELPPPPSAAGHAFAASFAGIEDIDGDGFRDLLVGAPPASLNVDGKVFLISGVSGAVILTVDGQSSWADFGTSVRPISDLDGDQRADLVVGSGNYWQGGSVFLYSSSSGSLLRQIDAPAGSIGFGISLATGEDVDGDGVEDILAGAPFGSNGSNRQAGAAFLISGATGLVLRRWDGTNPYQRFGFEVDFAGDLDGSGRSEYLISSPGLDRVHVYSETGTPIGSLVGTGGGQGPGLRRIQGRCRFDADGTSDVVTVSPYAGSAGPAGMIQTWSGATFLKLGSFAGSWQTPGFGSSLASVGDWDLDGVPDIACGSPKENQPGTPHAGAVAVLSGRDGRLLYHLPGTLPESELGTAVAAGSDHDGDGLPDLWVGAPAAPYFTPTPSEVRLYGSAGGLLLGSWSTTDPYDRFGSALALGDDLDGDGLRDLIVGAPYSKNAAGDSSGAIFFLSATRGFLGQIDGPSTGARYGQALASGADLDHDGIADLLVGAPGYLASQGLVEVRSGGSGALLLSIQQPGARQDLGEALCWAGDLDGDLVEDFLIGAPGGVSPSGVDMGEIMACSGATGTTLYKIYRDDYNGRMGGSIAVADDLNGDGVAEWGVGIPLYGTTVPGAGRFEVHSGVDGSLLVAFPGSFRHGGFGQSVAAPADWSGDGRRDFLVGSPTVSSGTGRFSLLSHDPYLNLSNASLSASRGGWSAIHLDFPDHEAGMLYAVLASASGIGPGIVAGVRMPLTQDRLFQLSGTPAAAAHLPDHQGNLDSSGDAQLTLSFGPGALTPLIGRTLYLAALTGSDPQTGRLSSAARRLEILP